MLLRIVIVGRPNVGKSTLFNRLVGKRTAIVDNMPGVTRDRREGLGYIGGLNFTVIDTAGFEENTEECLELEIKKQTVNAIKDAHVAFLLLDAKIGLTPLDKSFANWLRKYALPVVVIANKCEGRISKTVLLEADSLGFGSSIAISAEHGEGMADLFTAINPFNNAFPIEAPTLNSKINSKDKITINDECSKQLVTQIAIVGRPNVGKSTLFNQLIGQERMITGPKAGITRDAIGVPFEYKGNLIKIFDTAGLRRRTRITDKVETLSTTETFRAIQFAQIVILVLDSNTLLEKQDLNIARTIIDEGRGLLIAINKWDQTKNREYLLKEFQKKLLISLPQVRGISVIPISALTGYNVENLFPKVYEVFQTWNLRISTGKLNKWLKKTLERHPPPLSRNGKRITIRYATQIKTRPPTFNLFSSNIDKLPKSYFSYLKNSLRTDFKINGVPLRFQARKNKNPYD